MIVDKRGKEVTVWYIGGWKRSGTTLLCEMLGAFEGALAIGEVSGVWIALEKDRACSCGATSRTCPLWKGVAEKLLDRYPELDYSEMAEISQRVLRTRFTGKLLRQNATNRRDSDTEIVRYAEIMQFLYLSISQVSGCSILVDSSKLPPLAAVLHTMPNINLELIHIVRDPRAVANSERKSLAKTGDEPIWTPPGKSLWISVIYWIASNMAVWLTGRAVDSYRRVSYERLSAEPDGSMEEFSRRTGVARGGALMSSGHIVTGNPARMGGARRTVTRDDRWKQELALTDRWLVFLVSWPFMLLLR